MLAAVEKMDAQLRDRHSAQVSRVRALGVHPTKRSKRQLIMRAIKAFVLAPLIILLSFSLSQWWMRDIQFVIGFWYMAFNLAFWSLEREDKK